jgi:hypothetical protein
MNHTKTIQSVEFLVNVSTILHEQASYPADLPFILGEGNSLAGQGAPGLSNTFGAALWVSRHWDTWEMCITKVSG